MKQLELARMREVGKKAITEFIRSEAGSVGVKNAATIGVLAGALALSQSNSDAIDLGNGIRIFVVAI